MNKRRSKQEWQRIVKKWNASGQSQNRFCSENDISVSTFRYWTNKQEKKIDSEELIKLPFPVKQIWNKKIHIKTSFCSVYVEVDEETLGIVFRSLQAVSG